MIKLSSCKRSPFSGANLTNQSATYVHVEDVLAQVGDPRHSRLDCEAVEGRKRCGEEVLVVLSSQDFENGRVVHEVEWRVTRVGRQPVGGLADENGPDREVQSGVIARSEK